MIGTTQEGRILIRDRRRLWLFLPVLVLLPFSLWFYRQCTQLRPWDETTYFCLAQRAYLAYRTHGIWAALRQAYLGRDWAPTLHPVFIVPSLFLAHGKIMLSAAITSASFYAAFLLTIGLILSEFIPPLEAAIGALLLGSCPYVFAAGVTVMKEVRNLPGCGSSRCRFL